jgi:hypothetical protein
MAPRGARGCRESCNERHRLSQQDRGALVKQGLVAIALEERRESRAVDDTSADSLVDR